MNITNIIARIKPVKRGESDKYSWNLYRYLKEHRNVRICWYSKSIINGTAIPFESTKSLLSTQTVVLIGESGSSGNRIANILGNGESGKIVSYSLGLWQQDKFVDITEWFFREYLRIGRCIFDREHNGLWLGSEGRFTQINRNSRKCNWCGQHQRRRIEKVVKMERRVKWE